MSEYAMARICPDCFDDHSEDRECSVKVLKDTVKMLFKENFELRTRDMLTPNPALLKVLEVARLFRIHRPKVYSLIENGTIEAIKIGADWRIKTESVEKIIGRIPHYFFKKDA